jgi:hypothetical protein
MAETKQLVCEGACNPTIKQVDTAMREEARRNQSQPPFGEQLWPLQRDLKYTTHASTSREHFYRCLTCGNERRFGNQKWFDGFVPVAAR